MLVYLDRRRLKDMLLNNTAYLNNELDLPPVIQYMVKNNQITPEAVALINKEESRLTKINVFLSKMTEHFDISTYKHFVFALKETSPHLYKHLKIQERDIGTG